MEPRIGHPIKRIGFTEKYFTLWDVNVSEGYFHFHYVKNLSMNENDAIQKALKEENDIVKVDTTVDYELRGTTYFKRPAVYINNGIDTMVDFGKYSGHTLKEIIETDTQYFIWLSENCSNKSLSDIIQSLQWMQEYKEKIEKERQARIDRIENPIGNWVGNVGDKIGIEIKIKNIADWNTNYGPVSLYIMEDKDNNIYTWKTSPKGLGKNNTYKIKGTVKDYNSYNGIKQTSLTRCKII